MAEVARGVTDAMLDRLWAALASIPDRLTNREIAFISDPTTKRRVKEQMETAEYSLFQKYVRNGALWAVVASGLALRGMEGDQLQRVRLENLRAAIHSAHGTIGIRLAEVVQRGLLTDIIHHWQKEGATDQDIEANLEAILADILAHVEFMVTGGDSKLASERLGVKVSLSSPQIVMARGHAVQALRRTAIALEKMPSFQCLFREDGPQSFLIVFRKDQWDAYQRSPAKTPELGGTTGSVAHRSTRGR